MPDSDQPMIAECPSCNTRFRVTDEQLAVADGQVRCGACLAVFDGRARVSTDRPAVEEAEADPVEILLADPDAAPQNVDAVPPVPARDAAAPRARTRPVILGAAITAGLGLLAVGTLVLQFEAYAQWPEIRPVYGALGVDLPRFKALDAIEVANASVDQRLGGREPLVVRLNISNTASLAQRFPTLAVGFRAADGSLLAEQRVLPPDYVEGYRTPRMVPSAVYSVVLRLDDPGSDAVGYSLSVL